MPEALETIKAGNHWLVNVVDLEDVRDEANTVYLHYWAAGPFAELDGHGCRRQLRAFHPLHDHGDDIDQVVVLTPLTAPVAALPLLNSHSPDLQANPYRADLVCSPLSASCAFLKKTVFLDSLELS